ncbi:hypothetical protein [Pseudonocardia spirodelae]|uniref:Uncharacterized protein n=1 Tax=Pseudonocardia spirodelae TaxID=3133431 RepID=A0ABU8T9M9_9PSEU
MSAPAVRIPSPRRPVGATVPPVPAPRGGAVVPGAAEGRHRRREQHVEVPAPRRERSTSPQVPGVPAPRPASPGSAARPVPPAAVRRPARSAPVTPTARPARPAPVTPTAGPVMPPARSTGRPVARHASPQPSAAARALVVLGRVGSLTTIAAMLVVSAALAGLTDGNPPTGAAADVAVTTLR